MKEPSRMKKTYAAVKAYVNHGGTDDVSGSAAWYVLAIAQLCVVAIIVVVCLGLLARAARLVHNASDSVKTILAYAFVGSCVAFVVVTVVWAIVYAVRWHELEEKDGIK